MGSFAVVPPDTERGIRIVGTGPAAWLVPSRRGPDGPNQRGVGQGVNARADLKATAIRIEKLDAPVPA